MDDAPYRLLKTWKFKPAMCGVTSDSDIQVLVRLRMIEIRRLGPF